MNEIISALIAAGITAAPAARLAKVLQEQYGKTAGRFGTLDVTGAATVVGAVRIDDTADVVGDFSAGALDCSGGAVINKSLGAGQLLTPLGVVGCVRASNSGAQAAAPVSLNAGVNVRGGAAFGDNTVFQGPIQIKNKVDWLGDRRPATVNVVTGIFGNPNNEAGLRGKLATRLQRVAVLNDYGVGGWGLVSATMGATSAQVTATGTVTIAPNFTTETVYSIGTVTFNETNCSVEVTSTAVTVVTGWNPAVTVAITMQPTDPMPVFVGRTDDGPGVTTDKIINLHIQ